MPVSGVGMTDLPIEAALVYESAHVNLPAAYISVTPLAPEVLDIPVIETYWQLSSATTKSRAPAAITEMAAAKAC